MTAVLNGTEVLMTWEGPLGKLNGELQGYMVEYSTPAEQQVSLGHLYSQQKCNANLQWFQTLFLKLTMNLSFLVDSMWWIPD